MLDTLEVLCMLTYRDLFNIHTKYVDYLVAKTLIPLRLQNIAGGGSVVENEVRAFLRSMLPYRFRITHGHIVYCSDTKRQPLISSQIDLIVLDTLVPNTLFVLDPETGAEVVPLEAVVGILEIKRTLDKRSLVGDVARPINGEKNANIPQLSFLRKDGQTAKNVGALPFLKKVLYDLNINKTSDIRYVLGGFTVGAGLGRGLSEQSLGRNHCFRSRARDRTIAEHPCRL